MAEPEPPVALWIRIRKDVGGCQSQTCCAICEAATIGIASGLGVIIAVLNFLKQPASSLEALPLLANHST